MARGRRDVEIGPPGQPGTLGASVRPRRVIIIPALAPTAQRTGPEMARRRPALTGPGEGKAGTGK